MEKVRLGKTELMVTKNAFGVLPLQRVPMEDAKRILRKAFDYGINYFDTANAYTDSEEKIGAALHDVRHQVIISTKSAATDKKTVTEHIELSLRRLQSDYIDLFQFHNPAELPNPEDPDGAFAAALEAKKKGYIRHIGITNHRIQVAYDAVESGWFETMQYPFSYLATEKDLALVERCSRADMGFIAMKGLAGGMLNNAAACYAFMQQHPTVVPIWGIQRESELDEFVALEQHKPALAGELAALIEKDRKELLGNFCRGCGYCLPCPAGIEIQTAARMKMMLRRAPYAGFMTEEFYKEMHKIDNCINCGHCKAHCPYELDTPRLLKEMLADYDAFYAEHKNDFAK